MRIESAFGLELVNCPFCHSTDLVVSVRLRWTHKKMAIMCRGCGAIGPYAIACVTNAEALWNRRWDPKSMCDLFGHDFQRRGGDYSGHVGDDDETWICRRCEVKQERKIIEPPATKSKEVKDSE